MKGFICHGKKSELNSINYREPKKFLSVERHDLFKKKTTGRHIEVVFFTWLEGEKGKCVPSSSKNFKEAADIMQASNENLNQGAILSYLGLQFLISMFF